MISLQKKKVTDRTTETGQPADSYYYFDTPCFYERTVEKSSGIGFCHAP